MCLSLLVAGAMGASTTGNTITEVYSVFNTVANKTYGNFSGAYTSANLTVSFALVPNATSSGQSASANIGLTQIDDDATDGYFNNSLAVSVVYGAQGFDVNATLLKNNESVATGLVNLGINPNCTLQVLLMANRTVNVALANGTSLIANTNSTYSSNFYIHTVAFVGTVADSFTGGEVTVAYAALSAVDLTSMTSMLVVVAIVSIVSGAGFASSRRKK